jgi:preprotein translocase subunit SecE
MNDEAKQTTAEPTGADTAQLIAAILLTLGGIVAYYLLKSRPEAWASWAAMFGGIGLGVLLFAISNYGRRFWRFFLDSRVELRKVYWPTRQETLTTTMVVLVFVVIASIFFWVLDLSLASATKFFTGQGS